MRIVLSTLFEALVATCIVLLCLTAVDAQVMQSGSYRIQSDSINFGGGFASSTNYSLESTAGEVATGEGSSASYNLKAGYQQMQEVYIAISDAAAVSLSPSTPGLSGGTSNGSTSVLVTTDSRSGYQLTIAAEENPAMRSNVNTIADYAPAGANPDFTFTTGVSDAHLGYTPEGPDTVARFKDNGVNTCATGSSNTALACWDGLSLTEEAIAESGSANHPNGATTTIYFRVGVGTAVAQPPGTYVATTTLTALPL